MNIRKKSRFQILGILILILTTSCQVVFAADAYKTEPGGMGNSVASVEEYGGFEQGSIRQALANVVSSGVFESWLCPKGIDTDKCNPNQPGVSITARQMISPCDSKILENCIEGLEVTRSGIKSSAQLVETIGDSNLNPEVPDQGLWAAKGLSVYQDNSGSSPVLYAVSISISRFYDSQKQKWIDNAIDAGIYPFRIKNGTFNFGPLRDSVTSTGAKRVGYFNDPNCSWNDATRCAIPQDFDPGLRFALAIRVPNDVTGWFRGRITRPDVTVSKFSETNTRIVVEGDTVTIPRMRALVTPTNSTPEQQKAIVEHGGTGGNTVFQNEIKYPFSNWGEFNWIELFRDLAKDTAAGLSTAWNFGTVMNGGTNNSCLNGTSQLLGIVSTNATLYNGYVPEFINNELVYKVAGMHYQPDGKTPSLGTYDLVMRSDIARCLYGFTNAPVTATISVIGEGGVEKIATTLVNESNGWLKLAAYNFTFSTPEIRVKLQQPITEPAVASTNPTPTPTPSSTASAPIPSKDTLPQISKPTPAKTTITCIKGKTLKKVTAVNPKCPTGYKKK